jgi:hypothetical protein
MAITYPLSLPVATKVIQSIELRAINAVAYSRSPFTFTGQAFAYPGQMWQADITLPPMKRADAEQWVAWLLSLRGQLGTFLLGDPNGATARGAATGTPLVNGASQTGGSLVIDGAATSVTGWLKAGDYIQLGSNGSSTLHKVLADVNSDGSGNVTLDIWPHIRTAPADNATVTVSSAKGLFRLSSNEQAWSVNEAAIYGMTFGAMESV